MVLDSTECYRTFIAFTIVSSIQFHDRQIIKASNPVIILVVYRCYCSDLLNLQNLPELSRTSPHHNKHHKSYYKSKCIKKPIYYYSETRIGQIRHMRLRTECSSINHHLFLNNRVETTNCSCHQGVPETNSQYLFYCHRFNDSRNRYIESIDIPMNLTVDHILFGSPDLTEDQNNWVFFKCTKLYSKQ